MVVKCSESEVLLELMVVGVYDCYELRDMGVDGFGSEGLWKMRDVVVDCCGRR